MAKQFNQSKAVAANIDFLIRYFNLDRKETASIMGLSSATFYNRFSNPTTFQIGELELLAAWATKHGFEVTVAQLCRPFRPVKVDPVEVSA